jgi:hypothetical protein
MRLPGRIPRSSLLIALACAACSSGNGPADAGIFDGAVNLDAFPHVDGFVDDDRDGLDDAQELAWARQYQPFLSIAPGDECPLSGLLVRVSPHPAGMGLLRIFYGVLYNQDCGIAGHPGDAEGFGITVDPKLPPPSGIIAIKAVAHRGTACEVTSECGRCTQQAMCATLPSNSVAVPAVWPSREKHGNFVNRLATCEFTNTCLDECHDSATAPMLPIVNAGEPGHPLVSNLTTQGFITTQNGWTEMVLFNYDPWGGQPFGGGGNVAAELVDPVYTAAACIPSVTEADNQSTLR